jgi:uncharacterized protein (DUF924 family)
MASATPERAEDILRYWIVERRPDEAVRPEETVRWFVANDDIDGDIRARFGHDLEQAARGELADWARSARGRLALVIVLDQFSRNVHRGSARAFENDAQALRLCLDGIAAGVDRELATIERVFLYMPLQHAEDRDVQRRSVECFARLAAEAPPSLADECRRILDYAHRHREAIDRFGRFPHRNDVLGRTSSPAEIAFLDERGGFV